MYEENRPDISCCIDWVAFTLFDIDIDAVLSLFGFSKYDLVERVGANGYKKMYCMPDVGFCILYDGEKGMGIHIDIPSKALLLFLEIFRVSHFTESVPFGGRASDIDLNMLHEVIKVVKQYGHFTRIDMALDDLTPHFTVAEVWQFLDKDMYVAKFRKKDHYESYHADGSLLGETVYMGSRSSDMFLRVYDKQAEQKVDFPWIRWEFEIKHDCADIVADYLLNKSVCDVMYGTLVEYVRFINLDNERKSRCSIHEKWMSFVGDAKSMKYHVVKYIPTLEEKEDWIDKQVMPSICALMLASGGSLDFIENKIVRAALRMPENVKKRLNQINPNWQELLYYFDEGE